MVNAAAGWSGARLPDENEGDFAVKVLLVLVALFAAAPAWAQSQTTIEVESRGQKVRALLLKPDQPVGSVILMAGGHGNLDLGPEGRIGWGSGNQVVRTRAAYARSGFVTAVPDIAPDLKIPNGGVSGYRFGPAQAQDLGALVAYLRAIKSPIIIIGTSRGSISAANAVARLNGPQRPDAMVLTSAMLMTLRSNVPSVQLAAQGDPKRISLPLLIIGNKKDSCEWTLPTLIDGFKKWYEPNGGELETVMFDGPAGTGDPCEAESAHGFAGIDDGVVSTTADWIKKQNLTGR
jgi:hypothetical protein